MRVPVALRGEEGKWSRFVPVVRVYDPVYFRHWGSILGEYMRGPHKVAQKAWSAMVSGFVQRFGHCSMTRAVFAAVAFSCTLYYVLNAHNWAHYANRKNEPCRRKPEDLLRLIRTVHLVDDALNELGLTHYLLYGSLWGAIRTKGPLLWDTDADIGINGDELCACETKNFLRAFTKRGLAVRFVHQHGRYRVSDGQEEVDIMIFVDYWRDGMMRRTGWETWPFFVNYRWHHTFPAWLVNPPLPQLPFAGRNMTVPRGGVEIQKWLYRNNWWKETRPIGC